MAPPTCSLRTLPMVGKASVVIAVALSAVAAAAPSKKTCVVKVSDAV